MSDIRVLIVDDSAVVRRVLARIVEDAPGLMVAGQAGNGRLALEMIRELEPDLVTLDVEMPELDGLATLKELRRHWPRLPVIMFSTLTSRGAATTIEALSAGASDYLTKPEGASSLQESMERLRLDLVPRVKALARVRKPMGAPPSAPVAPAAAPLTKTATRETRPSSMSPASALSTTSQAARTPLPVYRPTEIKDWPESGRFLTRPAELLVIGVSTGGPNALARLMPNLPANLSVPVLIVQHMPPLFTRMLAERLDASCPLKVREAEAGAPLLPGEAWVARGDWHLEVARQGMRLILREHQGPPVNSCRPAVDILFDSAVKACGGNLVSVVLTGMGQDGMKGARAIREAGGLVLAQDEDSSVVWGMPGAVAMAGLADAVLPLDAMAARVQQALRPGRASVGRTN